MKNHIISLALLICFSSSIYSQDNESPWLFGVGVNSINPDDFQKSGYKLPSLSLSRYIFNNFSLGVNYSNNDVEISNENLYYYSIDGIIKYRIPVDSKILGVKVDPYLSA